MQIAQNPNSNYTCLYESLRNETNRFAYFLTFYLLIWVTAVNKGISVYLMTYTLGLNVNPVSNINFWRI